MNECRKWLLFLALVPILYAADQSLAPPDLGRLSRKQFQDRLSKAIAQSDPAPNMRPPEGTDTCAIPLLTGRVTRWRPLPREILPTAPANIDHMPIVVGRVCRDWLKK